MPGIPGLALGRNSPVSLIESKDARGMGVR